MKTKPMMREALYQGVSLAVQFRAWGDEADPFAMTKREGCAGFEEGLVRKMCVDGWFWALFGREKGAMRCAVGLA